MLISRLLCLALVAILAWPLAIGSPPAEPRGFATVPSAQAAPRLPEQAISAQMREPGHAGKRKARNRGDRDSRSNAKKARKADSTSSAPATGGKSACGPGLIAVGDTGRCTHGPDPAPPGVARDLIIGQPTAREVRAATENVPCAGDGDSGFRVQVIYAYDKSGSSRLNQVVGNIRMTAGGADDLMGQSSRAAGKELHFLFVHDAQCNIDVKPVGLSSTEMQSFSAMLQALDAGGQNRTDRIYLIFADTSSAGICGIGTMVRDDRDTANNRNNSGPSYSRVDRDCWAPQAATHELMHNLGGVQDSAPHSSKGSHCIDEWDVLCYSDTPNYPAMQVLCPDKATYQGRIDCNNDDYFNPFPQPGSYLDTHWNTAESVFLRAGPGICATASQNCLGTIALATSHSSIKSKKRLKVSATLSSATARSSTVTLRSCRGASCTWEQGRTIATLSGGSPSTQWKATGKGKVTFLARVTTTDGVMTSNPVTVKVKKGKKKR
ncbi:MAG: hypothetical protein M3Z20_01780 [Chloroflexota bacterium]|nr:hypothetical protein [Chloroflexota bacterium]